MTRTDKRQDTPQYYWPIILKERQATADEYIALLSNKMSAVKHMCAALERIAPARLAEKWDNVSL